MDPIMTFLETTLNKMGVQFSTLTPELDLEEDLGLESLMRVELATKLQKKFGKPVTDHIDNFSTVGDLLAFLDGCEPVTVVRGAPAVPR
jgi:acyl carrier protein